MTTHTGQLNTENSFLPFLPLSAPKTRGKGTYTLEIEGRTISKKANIGSPGIQGVALIREISTGQACPVPFMAPYT